MNFIILIYSQSDTICSFVESFLTTYSTELSDFGNDEIHSIEELNQLLALNEDLKVPLDNVSRILIISDLPIGTNTTN